MKKRSFIIALMSAIILTASCGNQTSNSEPAAAEEAQPAKTYAKVYDDSANPVDQINAAIKEASQTGRYVIAQVGGNWCRWCLMFADFISNDEDITKVISENFVYTHINVNHTNAEGKNEIYSDAMALLGNPMRFGYPVFVVLDGNGKVLHFQDSSYLEEGEGYNKGKVLRFFKNWTPDAVK